jgi:hypothetical protein
MNVCRVLGHFLSISLMALALAFGSEAQASEADVVKTLRVNGYDLSYIERGSAFQSCSYTGR